MAESTSIEPLPRGLAWQGCRDHFEQLFREGPAPMAVLSTDGRRLLDVNEAFGELLGYAREELLGPGAQPWRLLADADSARRLRDQLRGSGRLVNQELPLRRRDGRTLNMYLSARYQEDRQGCFITVTLMDVTERVRLRTGLYEANERLNYILQATRMGTWEWDVQSGETVYNERWAEILGYTLAELQPVTLATWLWLVHPDDMVASRRLLERHFAGELDFYGIELRMRHKQGHWVWLHERGRVVERDGEGRARKMYGTVTDITGRKALEEQVRELAIRDSLTGLYNRRHVMERLAAVSAESGRFGEPFSLVILDIDHFKRINDTYGHLAGDLVLREFALAVAASVRPYDLAGRLGGEEFLLVCPRGRAQDALAQVSRIMSLIRARCFHYEGREIRVTFSAGVADSTEVPPDSQQIDRLQALADRRLYRAKQAGRDRCHATG